MIAARHHSTCPDCDEPIEPGDMIGRIGLYYACSECVQEFERENRNGTPSPDRTHPHPLSSMYEPGVG